MTARERYLGMAVEIGDALCRDALWHGERCTWGGVSMDPIDGEWMAVWRTFGPSLYDGTAGVALFLAQLHAMTRDRKHAMAAIGGLRQALSLVQTTPPNLALGFYGGRLGIAYAADVVGRLCACPDISEAGARQLRGLLETDLATQESDVVSGLAGAVPVLLALAGRMDSGADLFRNLARRTGDALAAKARRHPDGAWSWSMSGGSDEAGSDLLGHSHGTAGIATAFLELWKFGGETRFKEAADRALAYERRWYNPNERNWPDLRSFGAEPTTPSYPAFWCHGAAGIGFSRLRCFCLTGAPELRAEAEIAIETTARLQDELLDPNKNSPINHNFSQCHGLSGNADLFLFAAEQLPEQAEKLAARAGAVAEFGIARHRRGGPWPCGVPAAGENPSLMLGLAGIGYFYLRLADPSATPTVLIIEPGRA
jgi:lantibiotic biosynthesis protein